MKPIRKWFSSPRAQVVAGTCAGVVLGVAGLLAFSAFAPSRASANVKPSGEWTAPERAGPLFARFGQATPAQDVRDLADWVADSGDAGHGPFLVIDKKNARMYIFDSNSTLIAESTILLGGARGDDTVPGIGSRPIEQVRPEERTTPAGRFVGERGHDARGEDVVWVDYDAAVSIHRVLTTNPAERRLERLASASSEDKRISYGCINVPKAFYEEQVQPVFARRRAVVYVLPEVKRLHDVFNMYEVRTRYAGR
jgi:hypothetical protein